MLSPTTLIDMRALICLGKGIEQWGHTLVLIEPPLLILGLGYLAPSRSGVRTFPPVAQRRHRKSRARWKKLARCVNGDE